MSPVHPVFRSFVFAAVALLSAPTYAHTCSEAFLNPSYLPRTEHQSIVRDLMHKHKLGKYGVRVITNENFETPDPERPLPINLPNGVKKYIVGMSGQNILLADSVEALAEGGIYSTHKVDLYNENGFKYGGEIDPRTGQELGYAFDSSTWDVAVYKVTREDGTTGLKVLAGAMGNDQNGKPMMIEGSPTRRRVFFDAEFKEIPEGSGQYRLVATNPKSPLTKVQPRDGNWVQFDHNGDVEFRHGYGGGPIMLESGDIYLDERGWAPVVHEVVWEQRLVADPSQISGFRKTPYRTVIAVTYMDRTLSKVMEPAKIIMDVYKPNGEMWKAADRPFYGPLVEGGHIDVTFNGKSVRSMADVNLIRKNGGQFDFEMLFSAGEYYSHYGSFSAHAKGTLTEFKPVLNEAGELYDFTAPLKVLFTWLGRPVLFHGKNGQEYVMAHGVDRASLSPGIPLDEKLDDNPHRGEFKRKVIVFPITRQNENGVSKIKIKDNTGLLEKIKAYVPRKTS